MPYTIHWERSGVYLKYSGDISVRSRQEALATICSDARFDALRFGIVDYLEVGDYEIQPGSLEEMAALYIGAFKTNPRIVLASVATRPDIVAAARQLIDFGFIEAAQTVVPSVEEARAWIARRRPPSE